MIARTVSRIVTRQISKQARRLATFRLALETFDDTCLEALERDIMRYEQTGIMPVRVLRVFKQLQGAKQAERPAPLG